MVSHQGDGFATRGLLSELPASDRQGVLAVAVLEDHKVGAMLLRAGVVSEFAYFPTTGAISLVRTLKDGSMIEIGIIGNEGVAGIDIFLDGGLPQPNDGIVQGAGTIYRVRAGDLLHLFNTRPEIQKSLLSFTNAFVRQVSQTAACNALHGIEQRLVRWLLMMDDRAAGGGVNLTQRYLSQMLGTRTASVNEIMGGLVEAGLLAHKRQQIAIVDRPGLEERACECYETLLVPVSAVRLASIA